MLSCGFMCLATHPVNLPAMCYKQMCFQQQGLCAVVDLDIVVSVEVCLYAIAIYLSYCLAIEN